MILSDFSDFLTRDNIIFFAIFSLIAIAIFVILFIIIRVIIRFVVSLFGTFFSKLEEKNKKNIEVAKKELEESQAERQVAGIKKMDASNTGGPMMQNRQTLAEKEEIKISGINKYKEKEQKDILESLNKLKSGNEEEKETLESKMPSRLENDKEDDFEKIKIPRAKKFEAKEESESQPNKLEQSSEIKELEIEKLRSSLSNGYSKSAKKAENRFKGNKKFIDNSFFGWVIKIIKRKKKQKEEEKKAKESVVAISSDLHSQKLVYDKDKIEAAKKTLSVKASSLGSINGPTLNSSGSQENLNKFLEKTGAKKEQKISQALKDDSIFGGKSEISRIELKHKLRLDPKIWGAEKQSGLTLSPIERAKLEKEVFSQALGRNISKTDLKWGIKKLGQKMISTKDSLEKTKIRKEIKFFKKIGGIK